MNFEIFQPIFDLFKPDFDLEHSAQLLHKSGCLGKMGLQIVLAGGFHIFPSPQLGVNGGVIKKCLDCGVKGEILERR